MASNSSFRKPLSWEELEKFDDFTLDRVNGPTNSQSTLRLFGKDESDVVVTLFRDNHAWCPYCQKVWLWLEEMQVPYRIRKVTMFCYGQKETWYKKLVPTGMLPALELDGKIITESDDILQALEQRFGPLKVSMNAPEAVKLRKLERALFRAWCSWLCYPSRSKEQEERSKKQFLSVVEIIEQTLNSSSSDYFLDDFSVIDCIFTPYVERMNASLFYYKGYSLREENPAFGRWFDAMEARQTYRGTQSDFHTHVHDLPPQMGGCYSNESAKALENQRLVNFGDWFSIPDVKYDFEPEKAKKEALHRVIKHHANMVKVNPVGDQAFDEALRCALTLMMTGEKCLPPKDTEKGLRYARDRVSVPRDMSIYAAKFFRKALEDTAELIGTKQGPSIALRHRKDQNPRNFL